MKSIYAAFVLVAAVAAVAADVSHLNNMYLPPHSGGLDFAASEPHHQQSQYFEQSYEIPQAIGADTYTPEHLGEPSNSLAADASQPRPLFAGSSIYPRLQPEDVRIDHAASAEAPAAQAEPAASQHEEVAVEQRFAESSQQVEQLEEAAAAEPSQYVEQQPAAAEFVPQAFGSGIVHADVPASGVGQQLEEHYETAASSSSGIDTQYGSNGGYVY